MNKRAEKFDPSRQGDRSLEGRLSHCLPYRVRECSPNAGSNPNGRRIQTVETSSSHTTGREFLITLPLGPRRIPVDNRTAIPYTLWMIIRSVQHKGLVRFIEDDDSRELRPDLVKRGCATFSPC